MRTSYLVIALGVYTLIVGLAGWVQSGLPSTILIPGTLAVITLIFGYLVSNGGLTMYTVTLSWVAFVTIWLAVTTVTMFATSSPRYGLLLGSIALFAAYVAWFMLRRLRFFSRV